MIEAVYSDTLYIGDVEACQEYSKSKRWVIIHACKEPCHRAAVGYTGRATEKTHPEYLVARRGTNHLYLNLVDSPNPAFFSVDMLEEVLFFLSVRLREDKNVLIHCNKAESRAPSLALLYIYTQVDPGMYSFEDAVDLFREIYPHYNPSPGIYEHMQAHWLDYIHIGHILAL